MKKIINGRKYNTDTAKEVGSWWNGVLANDLWYVRETLYVKKNGEFFLYGEGGAMTEYAQPPGMYDWCSGAAISPMTLNQAKEWAENKISSDEYEAVFGEVEE